MPVHYIEALGDNRHDGRRGYWLAHAGKASSADSMPCGHYEMLSAAQAEALADRLRAVLRRSG